MVYQDHNLLDDRSVFDNVALPLELAARSAYQPRASVTLWQKMTSAGGGPARVSVHPPQRPNRIRELEANLPKVQGLYERARRG